MKLGAKHSEESKQKMRIASLRNGNRPPSRKGISLRLSEEHKEKIRLSLLGRKHTEERRLHQRLAKLGKRRKKEEDYVSSVHEQIRKSDKYKLWRTAVYERDNHTCLWCGARNEAGVGKSIKLNADHIEAFSIILNKHGVDSLQKALICQDLWDIKNGRTLCVECHRKTETYGSKIKNLTKSL